MLCRGVGLAVLGMVCTGTFLVEDAPAQRDDATIERALTRQDVRDYIRLRIDVHQKQEEMKANADQYEDMLHAFFQWESRYLKKHGWTSERFEALEKRIMYAEKALEMVADSAEYRANLRRKLKAAEQSSAYTEAEREAYRESLARQDSIRQARHIDPTRQDWPAVRPYEDALEHLTDYVALNRSDPPDLETLPPAKTP